MTLLGQEGARRGREGGAAAAADARLHRQLLEVHTLGDQEHKSSVGFAAEAQISKSTRKRNCTLLYHAVTISFSSFSLSRACSHWRCTGKWVRVTHVCVAKRDQKKASEQPTHLQVDNLFVAICHLVLQSLDLSCGWV